jgi:hypothetical protein
MNAINELENKVEAISSNVKNEMNIPNSKNFENQMHKDPLNEANKYLAKKDVYEIFKVKKKKQYSIF